MPIDCIGKPDRDFSHGQPQKKPEKREEVTTEGGLDVVGQMQHMSEIVANLQGAGIPVSLFIDADVAQINAAASTRAKFIELHTGRYADAKVMAVARTLPDVATSPILDIGAGTGRNTLPLARLGYPVDALELAPAFALQLQTALESEALPGRVMVGDVLDERVSLSSSRYQCVILAEVVPHFHSYEQLRSLMERVSEVMASGGWLLLSTFLAVEGYEPDALALQMSRVTDAFVFTRSQLASALKNLPLQLISDESVVEYEQAHLPPSAWPPTEWFSHWASGRRLFALTREQPPVELRWILCQRL